MTWAAPSMVGWGGPWYKWASNEGHRDGRGVIKVLEATRGEIYYDIMNINGSLGRTTVGYPCPLKKYPVYIANGLQALGDGVILEGWGCSTRGWGCEKGSDRTKTERVGGVVNGCSCPGESKGSFVCHEGVGVGWEQGWPEWGGMIWQGMRRSAEEAKESEEEERGDASLRMGFHLSNEESMKGLNSTQSFMGAFCEGVREFSGWGFGKVQLYAQREARYHGYACILGSGFKFFRILEVVCRLQACAVVATEVALNITKRQYERNRLEQSIDYRYMKDL
eukprot:767838-Hanusia_phi.AAC.2